MKIRNGFVSNSSSSSFVVLFDKKPESREEVKKVLNIDREEIIDQIWERSQICDGHVRTVEEIRNAELHQEWSEKKKSTVTLTKEQADRLNEEYLKEYDWEVDYHKDDKKKHRKAAIKHPLKFLFSKRYRNSLKCIYNKEIKKKDPYTEGQQITEEWPWLNWLDHESFKMDAFPKEISEAIVKAIDSYFEVPGKPYKVAINMGDQHYGWDAGENADFSRIIYYTSESNMYALSNEEHPNRPAETLKERKERIDKMWNEESEED